MKYWVINGWGYAAGSAHTALHRFAEDRLDDIGINEYKGIKLIRVNKRDYERRFGK